MPYAVPAFAKIRSDLLRDLRNLLPDADIGPDSDFFVRASSVASAVEGLYQHQVWITKQIFPDTADTDYLELHAALRNITRKPAVAASGTLSFTGIAGSPIASGLAGTSQDGRQYVTTQAGAIGADGTVTLTAAAAVAGAAGNADAGLPITLTSPPNGVDGTATVVAMVGGVETESDTELLARLLDVIRRPPAGGNRYDFRRWALEVAGVTGAFPYPLRRGLGTIDVAIISGDGLPSADTIAAVQAHIDNVRPVTAKDFLAFAPTIRTVDIAALVALQGVSLASTQTGAETALAGQFALLAPGDTWIRSQAEGLITNLAGVTDRQIVSPASNVAPLVDETVVEWLRLGQVTLELMS